MDYINSVLNLVVPPASMVMLAFAWPTLSFIHACEWVYHSFYSENMEDKVVVITGASSGIGEQIAYEYAKRGANLVLVARREFRLWGISNNARLLGAKHVMFIAADVVKEDDCRRFIGETINVHGRGKALTPFEYELGKHAVDHLVNTASLGHTFFFEEAADTSVFPHMVDINFWGNVYPTFVALPYLKQSNGRIIVNASVESWLPMPRMSLYAAAKAAVINFYETLRFELGDEIGITIATHGWIGSELAGGKLMLEDRAAEMQWREEREAPVNGGGHVEEFAKMIVSGACKSQQYVKLPSWYDIFFVYRVFAPNVLGWTFRLLFASNGSAKRITSAQHGAGRPLLPEADSPRKHVTGPLTLSPRPLQHQLKNE